VHAVAAAGRIGTARPPGGTEQHGQEACHEVL